MTLKLNFFLSKETNERSKRYKSSGSSSFCPESRGESINLNDDAGGDDEENEVQEVLRPTGRDKAKALKEKGVSKSGSSANDEALAKMMISEMAHQTERDNELKRKQRAEWMAVKMKEVEARI